MSEDVRPYIEWMDGRHGSAKESLPSIEEVPVPEPLFELPYLHTWIKGNDRRERRAPPTCELSSRRLACQPLYWLALGTMAHGEIGWVPDGVDFAGSPPG